MKTRLLLLTALLSTMAFAFACGGAANNTNNANVSRNANANTSSVGNAANTVGNAANTVANTVGGAINSVANTVTANRGANTSNSNKIETTQKPPKGATAKCKDGTYSFSTESAGQCSGHGGVDKKF